QAGPRRPALPWRPGRRVARACRPRRPWPEKRRRARQATRRKRSPQNACGRQCSRKRCANEEGAMARDVHLTAARRPSRRGVLRDAGRVAAGRLAASALGLLGARRAFAIGERSLFRFARIALPGLPDPRPNALRRLAWEIVRRTSVSTASDPAEARVSAPNLFRYPFLVRA